MECGRFVPANMSLRQKSRDFRRIAEKLMRWRQSRRLIIVAVALLVMAGGLMRTPAIDGSDQTRMEMFAAGPFERESQSIFDRLVSRFSSSEEEPGDALIEPEAAVAALLETVPFGDLITTSAEKHEVDPILVLAVIEAESSFEQKARSPRGALGLMQLMPATGRWMGARNLLDPQQNIEAGTRYLKYLELRFKGDLNRQLAAYNAGEGTVKRYGGIPPYQETQQYVARVIENYERRAAEVEQLRLTPGI